MTTEITGKTDVFLKLNEAQRMLDISASAPTGTAPIVLPVNIQGWSSDIVRFLGSSVLLFTFGTLVLVAVLCWRNASSPVQILRIFGVISIIGVTTLLVVIGYSNEQLAPVIGLFGALAGYLLGREGATAKEKDTGC